MKKIFTVLLFCSFFFSILAADSYWKKNNPNSKESIDNSLWNDFLQKNIISQEGINRLDYKNISADFKKALDDYLNDLQDITITNYNSKEQKTYWINLYNALTVQVVLNHYPVESIRDIKLSGVFTVGPWKKKLVQIENKMLSLDDIEHSILRPIWNDSRVHYAVNCASIGCPNLQNVAFTSENIEELLEKAAKEYINHPRGVSFSNGRLQLSSIYKWFKKDFAPNEKGLIQNLQKYANPDLQQKLQNHQGRISYHYDWTLNDPE